MNKCWNWDKALNADGYGQVWINGKIHRVHRIAWEKAYGKIPKNMCILHDCDNRKCFNPDHLSLGTHKDNMNDRDKRNIGYHAIGEKQGNVKLTCHEVIKIRELYALGGITQRKLAALFKTPQSNIFKILHRIWWKHI